MAKHPETTDSNRCTDFVLEALSAYTSLARSILKAQCELAGLDPNDIQEHHLPLLAPRLSIALGRFTSPQKAETFRRELLRRRSEPPAIAATSTAGKTAAPSPGLSGLAESVAKGQLPEFAQRVADVLAEFTPLASRILEAQCARANIRVDLLGPRELHGLIPAIAGALARFTSPAKARAAADALSKFARRS